MIEFNSTCKLNEFIYDLNLDGNKNYIPIEKQKLIAIKPIKLYFFVKGRNSWHGTWINRYIQGQSLYESFLLAGLKAEQKRKQGNVFYIEELPAIVFKFEKNVGKIITQINTNNPLSEFNLNKFCEYINNKKEIFGEDIDKIFNENSSFWNIKPRLKNSYINIYVTNTRSFEFLENKVLKKYKSISYGTDKYLRWIKEKNYNISQNNIRKIAKCLL